MLEKYPIVFLIDSNAFIIVLEAKEKGEVIIDGWRLKEIYQIFLWPVALIECIIKSRKKIKESE